MKLPVIVSKGNGQVVLVFSDFSSIHIEGEFKGESAELHNIDSYFKDITHEYLSNTWGVVESKEHAEFIIELAELHGFEFDGNLHGMNYFYFNDVNLYITSFRANASPEVRKQITIPLPPKAKEWPQVGDEVIANHDSGQALKGRLLAKTKEYAIIQQSGHEQHLYLNSWVLKKPKSEQDLKIEELQTKLCNLNAVDNYILASEIVMGNVEGLSYE